MAENRKWMGIGAAARRYGVAESALRYWERRGLLEPAPSPAHQRRYGPDELHRIGLIRMWRETAMLSIDEIARILTPGEHGWRRPVRERLDLIAAERRRLEAAEEHLRHLLDCIADDPARTCPHLRRMTAAAAGDQLDDVSADAADGPVGDGATTRIA